MPEIRVVEAGEYVEWCGFIAGEPVFALADGVILEASGDVRRIRLHAGLSAAAPATDRSFVAIGGEDGRIVRFQPNSEPADVEAPSGKWIDAIACGPGGAIAASYGKTVVALTADGKRREFTSERSVEGLAFAPKGMRLALARYNGVELVWVTTAQGSQFLEWKGAHTGVTFSPDGKYIVSTMQENALHGWRLSDLKHMRMTGYPSKVKSMSFSRGGKWLATSGAPGAILWPFSGKDGPMGKAPAELGSMGRVKVTCVKCHPAEDVVAIGYEDGMVGAARIGDGKLAILRRQGSGAITSLSWDGSGRLVAFGSESGDAGVIDISR